MPTVLSGTVDDQDILQNERVIDMAPEIDLLQEDLTQFTTMLRKVASKTAHSSKVEWLTDELFPRRTTLAEDLDTSETAWDVASGTGSYFRAGDVVRIVSSGEAARVASIATDTVTVAARSLGDVAAATALTGEEIIIIGNAAAQGAGLGTSAVTKRVANFNYTQIVRHPYTFTNTLIASKLYGGSEPMKERKKKAIEHKRAMEYLHFLGARDLDTGGAEPIGFVGGLREYITTNVHDAAGTLTKNELDTFMRADLQHGSENKCMFVSPVAAQAISNYAADNWVRSDPGVKRWGVKIDAYLSGSYGFEVPVVVKKDWNDFSTAGGTSPGGSIYLVDMANVFTRPLENRNTKLLLNRQNPGDDKVTEEYLTEFSFQVEAESKHARIHSISG